MRTECTSHQMIHRATSHTFLSPCVWSNSGHVVLKAVTLSLSLRSWEPEVLGEGFLQRDLIDWPQPPILGACGGELDDYSNPVFFSIFNVLLELSINVLEGYLDIKFMTNPGAFGWSLFVAERCWVAVPNHTKDSCFFKRFDEHWFCLTIRSIS